MKQSIQQLREQRQAKAAELRAMVEDKSTPWDAARQERFDAGAREIEAIDASIAREQQVLAFEAESRIPTLGRDDQRDERDPRNAAPKAVFNRWLRAGVEGLSPEQRAVMIQNTMSTTTPAQGGFTVQTEVANTVLDALRAFGGMREAAQVIRTADGSPMNWPISDGTTEEGEIVAENALSATQSVAFGVRSMGVFRYSSRDVAVPFELLQDSTVDIEAFVNQRLVTRLGRITNRHFTVGTGTGEPTGILAVSGGAPGAAAPVGNATSFTYDALIDFMHSVDPAYRGRPGVSWMMNDRLLRELRKLRDGQQRPIFIPGFDVSGLAAAPGSGTLLGYPIRINQDVPLPAANARSLLFGDFSSYVIRDCMDLTFFRFTDSAYTRRGQVGFLAMLRSGGNYIDASTSGAVRVLINSAT